MSTAPSFRLQQNLHVSQIRTLGLVHTTVSTFSTDVGAEVLNCNVDGTIWDYTLGYHKARLIAQ